MCLVERPDELPLVVLGHPGDVWTTADHPESHDLQRVQHHPRGQAELGALQPIILVLRLVLDL